MSLQSIILTELSLAEYYGLSTKYRGTMYNYLDTYPIILEHSINKYLKIIFNRWKSKQYVSKGIVTTVNGASSPYIGYGNIIKINNVYESYVGSKIYDVNRLAYSIITRI